MKRSVLQIIFITLITMITTIFALTDFNDNYQISQLDGALLYNKAVQKFASDSANSYTVQTQKKIITDKNVYTESLIQEVVKYDSDSGEHRLSASNILSIGDYKITSTSRYENGTAYLTLDDSCFSSKYAESTLQKQYAPAILLTPGNYKNIQAYSVRTGAVVYFTSAVTAEPWATDENMVFQQAVGIALLDKKGALTETIYCIRYQAQNAGIEKAVIVKPTKNDASWEPIDKSSYTPIDSLNAPIALELACGYLLQSDAISAESTDTITCDAFGDRYIQNIVLNYTGSKEDFSATLRTNLLQQNSSRGGEITETTQSLIFSNGVCSISTDNTSPVTDASITKEAMTKYCQDVLIGTILLPQDISGAKCTVSKDQYRFDFTATEELANTIAQTACTTLYNDSAFLQKLATTYTSKGATAYIILDKATCIPIASGISYQGTFVIDNFSYELAYTAEQSYH